MKYVATGGLFFAFIFPNHAMEIHLRNDIKRISRPHSDAGEEIF